MKTFEIIYNILINHARWQLSIALVTGVIK